MSAKQRFGRGVRLGGRLGAGTQPASAKADPTGEHFVVRRVRFSARGSSVERFPRALKRTLRRLNQNYFLCALLVLVLLGSFAFNASAQKNAASKQDDDVVNVRGRVLDPNGKPLAGA